MTLRVDAERKVWKYCAVDDGFCMGDDFSYDARRPREATARENDACVAAA